MNQHISSMNLKQRKDAHKEAICAWKVPPKALWKARTPQDREVGRIAASLLKLNPYTDRIKIEKKCEAAAAKFVEAAILGVERMSSETRKIEAAEKAELVQAVAQELKGELKGFNRVYRGMNKAGVWLGSLMALDTAYLAGSLAVEYMYASTIFNKIFYGAYTVIWGATALFGIGFAIGNGIINSRKKNFDSSVLGHNLSDIADGTIFSYAARKEAAGGASAEKTD